MNVLGQQSFMKADKKQLQYFIGRKAVSKQFTLVKRGSWFK